MNIQVPEIYGRPNNAFQPMRGSARLNAGVSVPDFRVL